MSAFSQLPSAQTNPYAQVTYFGVAYSDPLQDNRAGEKDGVEVVCNFR